MHESGLADRLLALAEAEARARGKRLVGVRVRLGALAATAPERLRADFEHLREHHGRTGAALEIEVDPDRPSGVEIVGIEVAG